MKTHKREKKQENKQLLWAMGVYFVKID